MNQFDGNLKVKDALPIYFSRYHFKDGGYNDKWFKIKLGPVYIPMPNIKMRVDAVKIHDIHHLVTEYEANMKGEVAIGGWELASGCFNYPAAWILNLGSFAYGMLFHQRTLLDAFLKGKRSVSNLYHNTVYDDVLLNKTIGELREKIQLSDSKGNSTNDYLQFAFYCIFVVIYHSIFLYLIYKLIRLFL